MKKKYFSALIPESNLDIKYKRLQVESVWSITFPPIAPLEYYKKPIMEGDFPINIDNISEFKTGRLTKKDNLWIIELPIEPFKGFFNVKDLGIILGRDTGKISEIPVVKPETIRNWELGFYELIEWDEINPEGNIELNRLWKIKKRRPKG